MLVVVKASAKVVSLVYPSVDVMVVRKGSERAASKVGKWVFLKVTYSVVWKAD